MRVICMCLLCSGAQSADCCAAYGQGSGSILLDDLNCPSGAANLDACSGWSWGQHNCAHSEDASVVCINTDDELEGTCKYLGILCHALNGKWNLHLKEAWTITVIRFEVLDV